VEFHFLDVGIGNMTLMITPGGTVIMYDCNITQDNESGVMAHVGSVIGRRRPIDVFINSHRDADHMRGIGILNDAHPIQKIQDTGVPGTTTDSPEYEEYMDLLRQLPSEQIAPRTKWTYGPVRLRCLSAAWDDYSEPNEQSVVLKIEYAGAGVMLAGDTNYRPWKEKILPFYGPSNLKSSILLAAHHGSRTFFDDPSDEKSYYTSHIKAIAPAMTLVSVGPNVHGLPDDKALELYEKNSSGSANGNKVFSTQEKGTMKLILKADGGWSLSTNQ